MKALYTAEARATGGRDGRVITEDGLIDLKLAIPAAMGGAKGAIGTNPEQLFAAGYAACFHSAMLFVAGQKRIDARESSVTGFVSIGMRDDGPGFGLAVRHVVELPHLSQSDAEALVDAAHQVCPYSNATRGNIAVDFEVHGRPAETEA